MTARFKVQPRSVVRLRRMGTGPAGADAWSPRFAVVSDGERRVLQVADWIGGDGTKPVTGQYLGASGFVDAVASAVDVRGGAGGIASDIVFTPTGNIAATNVQAALAEVDSEKADAGAMALALAGKSDTGHTHTSASITDFTEAVQDVIGSGLIGSGLVGAVYDDAGNTMTLSVAVASQAEAAAGTDNTKGMTPLRTAQAIAALETVGRVSTYKTAAVATGTTVIPADDTIPQSTEGDQYMSVAFTPKDAGSTLIIEVLANLEHSAGNNVFAALFKDSDANALATGAAYTAAVATPAQVLVFHEMVAGTTSAITFKVRCGSNSAGTTTFNGRAGARRLGGTLFSYIKITEVLP